MPEMDASRSPAGGWSGVGTATHGDFVQVKRGNVVVDRDDVDGVETVCGGWYPTDLVTPANLLGPNVTAPNGGKSSRSATTTRRSSSLAHAESEQNVSYLGVR